MTGRTIKVSITLTLEVDVDAWSLEYGTDATASAVRADVKQYFGNEVQGHHLTDSGIIVDSDWK